MLFVDHDCVHSNRHGYGQVVRGGRNPVVRWLSGLESQACGSTLKLVSDGKYASVVTNNHAAEDWMHRCVYGVPLALPMSEPRVKPDLLTRLQEAAREFDIPSAGHVEHRRLWFMENELVASAYWASDEDRPQQRLHVRVEVRRMDESDSKATRAIS